MTKKELLGIHNQLLDEKRISRIDGIHAGSKKSEIENSIACLRCTDDELNRCLEVVKKEYPNTIRNILENPTDFKIHPFNRLHIYNTARMIEA